MQCRQRRVERRRQKTATIRQSHGASPYSRRTAPGGKNQRRRVQRVVPARSASRMLKTTELKGKRGAWGRGAETGLSGLLVRLQTVIQTKSTAKKTGFFLENEMDLEKGKKDRGTKQYFLEKNMSEGGERCG